MPDLSTADLFDRFGDALRVCAPLFRDFGGRTAFAGSAVTVKCFEDNSRIKEALAEPGQGRVLVADCGGSLRCAMLGDMIAEGAVEQGWAGVLIDGCVRDLARLAELDLGIKALAPTPRKSTRRGEGQRDLPVQVGGVAVHPGDTVVCDRDGILVAPPSLLSELLNGADPGTAPKLMGADADKGLS
jgi:regulator of ribonuclease activity A